MVEVRRWDAWRREPPDALHIRLRARHLPVLHSPVREWRNNSLRWASSRSTYLLPIGAIASVAVGFLGRRSAGHGMPPKHRHAQIAPHWIVMARLFRSKPDRHHKPSTIRSSTIPCQSKLKAGDARYLAREEPAIRAGSPPRLT